MRRRPVTLVDGRGTRAISDTVNYLAASSPRLRRFIWHHAYQSLNRIFAETQWHFLSYGYVDTSGAASTLALDPADEADRPFVQLYARVAASAGLAGKDVLEVSSGRGGGTAFLAKYLGPRFITGMDRSERAVRYSTRHHRRANLAYCAGDAEALPFRDACFDVVVNVESSHCYGSMTRFLREVRRVLRPGGLFVWADVRNATELAALDAAFEAARLPPAVTEDITANVLASLDQTNARKMDAMRRYVPRPMLPLMRQFAGVPGSIIYEELACRAKRYLHYACRKD
jgi:ubiquinone/menaquinone biosynthesis C-methylase UbiE